MNKPTPDTPWRRVARRLRLPPAELARLIKRDKSKIYRHLNDPDGLINGVDQAAILKVARELGIKIPPKDLVPNG